MDEDNSTTKISVKQLAAMLAGVADNYSVGCTVKAIHFNRSAGNRIVLEVDTGHGCTHEEWIDVWKGSLSQEKQWSDSSDGEK